jgi:hypothetical protein
MVSVLSVGAMSSLFNLTTAPMEKLLSGSVTDGQTVLQVNYDSRAGAQSNVVDGAAKFDALAHSTAGPKIGFGYDLGAAALTYWLQHYGPTSTIPHADLGFVLVGNPARTFGGFLNSSDYISGNPDGLGRLWTAAPTVIPTGTPYTVLDVACEYDGLCDYPDATTAPDYQLAVNNAGSGAYKLHFNDYNDLLPSDPDNHGWTVGNITYILRPTMPLPIIGFLIFATFEQVDKALRPGINACYSWDRTGVLYTPMTTEPFPAYGTVACAEPDHFYVADGKLVPQPWMQHRAVASVMDEPGSRVYAVNDGLQKMDTITRVVAEWTNLSPIPHWVYGVITRGGVQVTLTARSRGYLQVWSGLSRSGELPVLTESSRIGVGSDIGGARGLLAFGIAFCVAEMRQNSRSMPLAPERIGWMMLQPGETAIGEVEVRFISEFWESAGIDGGAAEAVSGFQGGATKLDLFAVPVIEAASAVTGSFGSGPPTLPGGVPYDVPFDVGT